MVSNCVFRPCVLLRVLVFLFLFVLCMRVGLLCVDRSRRQGMNGGAGEAARLELADASRGKKGRD